MNNSDFDNILSVVYGLYAYLNECFKKMAAAEAYIQINNETNGSFLKKEVFFVSCSALLEMLIVSLATFFDPPSTRGHQNCSLKKLKALLEKDNRNKQLIQSIISSIDAITYDTIRTWRIKKLAHHDLVDTFNNSSDTTTINELKQQLMEIQDIVSKTFELIVGVPCSAFDYSSALELYKQTLIAVFQ